MHVSGTGADDSCEWTRKEDADTQMALRPALPWRGEVGGTISCILYTHLYTCTHVQAQKIPELFEHVHIIIFGNMLILMATTIGGRAPPFFFSLFFHQAPRSTPTVNSRGVPLKPTVISRGVPLKRTGGMAEGLNFHGRPRPTQMGVVWSHR